MTAIAYYTARGHAIASYGPSLGIAAGLYRFRATREEFRWPLYGTLLSEDGVWNGRRLKIGGREVMKSLSAGAKANLVHLLRGTAYVTLGLSIIPLGLSSYGATVTTVKELRDPRLTQLTRELKAVIGNGRPTGQGGKDAGSVFRERRERLPGRGKGRVEDDDMSPTGGGLMGEYGVDEEQGRLNGAGSMGGLLSDQQMQTREMQAQPEQRKSPTENRASTFQMDKVARQPQNFSEDFDDASPTGGSGAMDGDGTSAWGRIRQQSASGTDSGAEPSLRKARGFRREQQEGSTTGDSFSFSNSEEERSYAKDEAQKEFDERVEKERRGGDFSGSGGESGWRR